MADTDLPLSRIGGRVNTDTGQLLSTDDVDRIGGMSLQSMVGFLSLLFFDGELGVPASGFPRDIVARDHCRVSASTDLGFSVSTGFGLLYNASATVDEFGPDVYRPIVVSSTITDSLAAHDGSNPRIDLVCLAPAWVDDQSASRNVKNPGTGVVSSSSVNQRRRFGAAYQIVTGAPAASPSIPAVPNGYIAVGMARVPAGSGPAVWTDVRQPLHLGDYFKALPRYATGDYVPKGGTDELAVTASSPVAMTVELERGRAVINGTMRAYADETLTITTAHATLPRIDLVVARQNGTVTVEAGTASAVPSAPALPANSVPLAEVFVGAAATSIGGANITDVRDREPFTNAHVQERSLDHSKLAKPTVKVDIGTVTGTATETITIPFDVTWPDGDALPDTPSPADYIILECRVHTILSGLPGATTPGDYGDAGSQTLEQTLYDSDALLTFMNLFKIKSGGNLIDHLGIGTDLVGPSFYVRVVDPTATSCEIELRRAATGNLTFVVEIRPVSQPGYGDVVKITCT